MSARAHVAEDWPRNLVRIAARLDERRLLNFGAPSVVTVEPDVMMPDDYTLDVPEDVARAIYEALADHFGHSGHDTRALRRDYEAERKRVDTFITHLTRGGAA